MWHLTFSNWAIEAGFEQSQHDPCLFLHSENEQMLIIYVDDMILAASNKILLEDMKDKLISRFESRTLGEPTYFLGMNLSYEKESGTVLLSQQTYIEALVEKYELQFKFPKTLPLAPGMVMVKQQGEDMYKPAEYGSLIGALLFVAVSTRPDVAFAVGLLARFVSKPSVEHWNAAENVLLYLKGTKDRGILL